MAATDASVFKREAKLSTLQLEKSASRQSRLLQLKYSAIDKVVKKGRSSSSSITTTNSPLKRLVKLKRSDQVPMLSQRQVGLTTMTTSQYDTLWGIPFQIVNSKQVNLAYDTGSSITIINKDAYKPSSLAQATGYSYEIGYMDGTRGGGDIYNDYITVAGLTMWTSIVWADSNFLDNNVGLDGIVGVGFAGSVVTASLIESMVQNFTLLSDVICMTMTSESNGALQFGALDATIVNEIKYTDVLARRGRSWDTTASINGVGHFDVIIDTGTTYIYLPTKIAEQLFAKLGLQTIKTTEGHGSPELTWGLCDQAKGAPQLSVMLGDIPIPFTITSKNSAAWLSNDCRLSIIGTSQLDRAQMGIFGAAFLKNVHFVMDRGLYKMGFSQRIV